MNAQLPAHLQNRARRNLAQEAVSGISVGAGPHISITANRFTLIDQAGNEKPVQTLYLDVCIVAVNKAVSKIFYDPRVPYDPNNSGPPVCFSDNGVGASSRASQPQSQSCAACQWNAWGSATSKLTGAQTKACNDVKKVGVLVAGSDIVFMLRVPPASLKNFAQYAVTAGGHGVDLPDVYTRLEFESQGVLKFSPAPIAQDGTAFIDAQFADYRDHILDNKVDTINQLLGKTDVPWGGQGAPQLAPPVQSPPQHLMPPPAPVAPAFMSAPAPQAQGFGAQAPQGFAPTQTPAPQPDAGSAQRQRKPRGAKAVEPAPQTPPFMAAPVVPFVVAPAGSPAPFASPTPSAPTPSASSASPQQDTIPNLPPFLQRNPPQGAPVSPPPLPPQAAFGMQPNPPAPDAGMQEALNAAFNLPIPGGPQ